MKVQVSVISDKPSRRLWFDAEALTRVPSDVLRARNRLKGWWCEADIERGLSANVTMYNAVALAAPGKALAERVVHQPELSWEVAS